MLGIRRLTFLHVLAIGFAIRLLLLPLAYHSDINNHFIWGTYANEFGFKGFYDFLNFGNYARPDYPPLAILLFTAVKKLYDLTFSFLWQINISLPVFPSGIITWLDQFGYKTLLKFPSVVADIGISYLIYIWAREKVSQQRAKIAAALYLFNPGIIYLSALWGQIDSVAFLFAILCLYFLQKNHYSLALLAFMTSVLFKATFVPLALPFLIWVLTHKPRLKDVVLAALSGLLFAVLVAVPFTDKNALFWIIGKYKDIFIIGPSTLPYLNLNAFNFWGLVLGLERISIEQMLAGIELGSLAYFLGGVFVAAFSYFYVKRKQEFIYYTMMVYWAIFMFFPKIHERYFFAVVAFLPLLYLSSKAIKDYKAVYATASLIFIVNLYHWWWFPELTLLRNTLSLGLVERGLSLASLAVFFKVVKDGYFPKFLFRVSAKAAG